MNERLRDVVAKKLEADWSPQQISGWLLSHYPDDEAMRVSQETIYRTRFVQAKGVLKRELLAHLRSGRMMRLGPGVHPQQGSSTDRSKTPSRSVSVHPPKPKTGRCPDIGKGI